MTIFTYIDGEYVEAVWDAERKAYVFPKPFRVGQSMALALGTTRK